MEANKHMKESLWTWRPRMKPVQKQQNKSVKTALPLVPRPWRKKYFFSRTHEKLNLFDASKQHQQRFQTFS